jgi:predicted kinase
LSQRVYAGLLERARPVVSSGRPAILDATFGRREQRAITVEWAESLGAPVRFVEARCAPEVVLDRLTRREAEGIDPSDAGPDFYAESVARFEPVREGRAPHVVHTDEENWRASVSELAGDLRE